MPWAGSGRRPSVGGRCSVVPLSVMRRLVRVSRPTRPAVPRGGRRRRRCRPRRGRTPRRPRPPSGGPGRVEDRLDRRADPGRVGATEPQPYPGARVHDLPGDDRLVVADRRHDERDTVPQRLAHGVVPGVADDRVEPGRRASWGTWGRRRMLSGTGPWTRPPGSTSTARTRPASPPSACAAAFRKRAPASLLAVPRLTRTVGSGDASSQSQEVVAARGAVGDGRAHQPDPVGQFGRAEQRTGGVRQDAVRGEAGSAEPAPSQIRLRNRASSPSSHAATFGIPASGSTSSAEVVAEVTQTRPRDSATSAPATACWSQTTTSGSYASIAARTPGAIASASGTRKLSQRNWNAAGPFRSAGRERPSSGRAQGKTTASDPTRARTSSGWPAHATSCPRPASAAAVPTAGLTCPTSGGTTNRKRPI